MKLAVACLVLTGCFYIDPINRRPQVDPITCVVTNDARACANDSYLRRADRVEVSARVFDPDGTSAKSTYAWEAFACSDVDAQTCDRTSYFQSQLATPTLSWPALSTGVRSIRVNLDVRDDRGALASQTVKFFVNDAPSVTLTASDRAHAVGAPMELTAMFNDVDEGPAQLTLGWQVIAPVLEPPAVLADVAPDPASAGEATARKRLVPSTIGTWTVQVTATDRLGAATAQQLSFDVGPDQPPCLTSVQPIVPPADVVLPIVEPTVFSVPLVSDELDAYPRLPGDPVFGTTTFAWSILPPGATTRQPLVGATGNSIDFDPAAFTPGQRVELRVEVFDRNRTAVACSDAQATCASAARPMCSQRQTWLVEVR